jgi:hypothetical protein
LATLRMPGDAAQERQSLLDRRPLQDGRNDLACRQKPIEDDCLWPMAALALFTWPDLAVNSAVIHGQDRLLVHPDERALMAVGTVRSGNAGPYLAANRVARVAD